MMDKTNIRTLSFIIFQMILAISSPNHKKKKNQLEPHEYKMKQPKFIHS